MANPELKDRYAAVVSVGIYEVEIPKVIKNSFQEIDNSNSRKILQETAAKLKEMENCNKVHPQAARELKQQLAKAYDAISQHSYYLSQQYQLAVQKTK